jgi:hypothetical protein
MSASSDRDRFLMRPARLQVARAESWAPELHWRRAKWLRLRRWSMWLGSHLRDPKSRVDFTGVDAEVDPSHPTLPPAGSSRAARVASFSFPLLSTS